MFSAIRDGYRSLRQIKVVCSQIVRSPTTTVGLDEGSLQVEGRSVKYEVILFAYSRVVVVLGGEVLGLKIRLVS